MLKRDKHNILRVALDLEESVERKRGRLKETWKKTSGRRDREDWFQKGGCPESTKVEKRSAGNCRKNGVNPAVSAKQHGIKTE